VPLSFSEELQKLLLNARGFAGFGLGLPGTYPTTPRRLSLCMNMKPLILISATVFSEGLHCEVFSGSEVEVKLQCFMCGLDP
jgi:hypothetical protein